MKLKTICLGLALLGLTLTPSAFAGGKLSTVGEVSGTVAFDPPTFGPGTFEYEYTAQGEISNLGQVEFLAFGTSSVDALLNITPQPPTTFIARDEDGDVLIGIIRWTSVAAASGGYDFGGTYTISAGTGKFGKVKGSGRGTGVLDVTTFTFSLEIEGTVTQPKVPKAPKPPKVKPPKKNK